MAGCAAIAIAGVLALGLNRWDAWWGDLGCAADVGDSNYGEYQWSWWPVGGSCRWTETINGFNGFEGPDWSMTAVIGGSALVGFGLVASSVAIALRSRS